MEKVIEKPRRIYNRYKGCGIYLFDETIFDAVARTTRTCLRDEYELTEAIQIMIDNGAEIYHQDAITEDINITLPDDLHSLNMGLIDEMGQTNILGEESTIATGSHVVHSVVGRQSIVEENVKLYNCLVFPKTLVKAGTKVKNAILTKDTIYKLSL